MSPHPIEEPDKRNIVRENKVSYLDTSKLVAIYIFYVMEMRRISHLSHGCDTYGTWIAQA